MLFKRMLSLVIAFSVILLFVLMAMPVSQLNFTGLVAAQEIDTDGDGMNDTWETTHFGDLSQNANDDYDNDTYTNLEEFEAGTNPNDPDDHPEEDEDDEGFWTQTKIIIAVIVIAVVVFIGAIIAWYLFRGGGDEYAEGGMPGEMGGPEPGGAGGDFLDEGLEMDEDEGEFEEEEGMEMEMGMGEEEEEEYEEEEEEGLEEEAPAKEDAPDEGAPSEEEPGGPTLQEKVAFVKEKFAKGEITQEQFEMVIIKLQEEDQAKKEEKEEPPKKAEEVPSKKEETPPKAPRPSKDKSSEKKPKAAGRSTGYECQKCGGLMKDIKGKCPGCGAKFVANMAMCPLCETRVPLDATECKKCGALFIE